MIIAKKNSLTTHISKGSFTVSDESIPTESNFTLQIPLGRSDYQQGHLVFYTPYAGASESKKRRTSFIVFTTELNDAIARSSGMTNISVAHYIVKEHWIRGYTYEIDGYLSDAYFEKTGYGRIRITSCQINGSNIVIVFRNTNRSWAAVLNIEGRYHVYR